MKKIKNLSRNETGQTLLEILLAFSVSILVLSAVILGIITSLSNTQYSKNQSLANSFAQEGMAIIRKIRDSNLDKFSLFGEFTPSDHTIYCLGPNQTDLNNEDKLTSAYQNCWAKKPVPTGGIFSREIRFEHQSPNCCFDNTQTCGTDRRGSKATVTVAWSDNKCLAGNPFCHKVELITCFSNIDRKSTP
jgi:hypothetical protein